MPSWVHNTSDAVSIKIVWGFITGLLSSTGGNTTITWTGATSSSWSPSSQNHSAILYSAGQLYLPLPTAALPNFSSGSKGPTQLLTCFRLLSQNLALKSNQLGAIKACTLSTPHTHKSYRCLTSTHPLFSELEDTYLLFSRLISPDIPLFGIMPPEFLLELSPWIPSPLPYVSHSLITFTSASKHVQVTHLKKVNKTPQFAVIWALPPTTSLLNGFH